MERSIDANVILASYSAHNDFRAGILWMDYEHELRAWLDDVRNQLETEQDISVVRHLQGVAEACRNFLLLPDNILEALRIIAERDENGAE